MMAAAGPHLSLLCSFALSTTAENWFWPTFRDRLRFEQVGVNDQMGAQRS
jgi:hypothetical protein